MRNWLLFASVGLLALPLAGCGAGGAAGPSSPPPGSFSLVAPEEVAVMRGASSAFDVDVRFGSGFLGSVTLDHNDLPNGYAVLYDGVPLAAALAFEESGSVTLELSASGAAEVGNVYFELIGQGLDEDGSAKGQPRRQTAVRIGLR